MNDKVLSSIQARKKSQNIAIQIKEIYVEIVLTAPNIGINVIPDQKRV